MTDTLLASVQRAFLSFDKRAENVSNEILEATFVDTGPLFDLVSTKNSQVVYGRRGTGKTHVLKYLQRRITKDNEYPVYIDLRSVGSNGSIYNDGTRSLSERASTLIIDVLNHLQSVLYSIAVDCLETAPDARQISLRLDDFGDAISGVRITGETHATTQNEKTTEASASGGLSFNPSSLTANFNASNAESIKHSSSVARSGKEILHLNFGKIGAALAGLVEVLGISRLWLLVDEWSEIPLVLQPYLADLLRRTVLPIGRITLKIAAIDHRSNFSISHTRGEYIGLELGADISADLNLDDFLVFDNKEGKASDFFKRLIFQHYLNSEHYSQEIRNADKLIQIAFTQQPVFDEFVRAVEGVPRDALNLAAKVATKAFGSSIAMTHVRAGSRDWYQQDKHAVIREDQALDLLLTRIIEEVIGIRKARAFLLQSNKRVDEIERLFDSRILHILKKNVSSRDEPGVRYDVYKVDYGCYVDLINTVKNPDKLFGADDEYGNAFNVDVPTDDYRSIRRAILRPEEFGLIT
ncbi:hypothetical protein [Brucella intermedia]|uniref:ORC-CDC6 family AAA ATPase n=1 Tax=Brucella intermedia TaxID=94625 RepID=UPI000EFB9874|nr:hypothetical protein [Brucella intermedia]QNQ39417.1 hypothetical protein IAR37_08505 [Brucella intermedia]